MSRSNAVPMRMASVAADSDGKVDPTAGTVVEL